MFFPQPDKACSPSLTASEAFEACKDLNRDVPAIESNLSLVSLGIVIIPDSHALSEAGGWMCFLLLVLLGEVCQQEAKIEIGAQGFKVRICQLSPQNKWHCLRVVVKAVWMAIQSVAESLLLVDEFLTFLGNC